MPSIFVPCRKFVKIYGIIKKANLSSRKEKKLGNRSGLDRLVRKEHLTLSHGNHFFLIRTFLQIEKVRKNFCFCRYIL